MPTAAVSVISEIGESMCCDAILDTGSSYNIIDIGVAEDFLGKNRSEIMTGRPASIGGVGTRAQLAYGWPVSLRLKPEATSSVCMIFKDVWLYASDLRLTGFPILIGQHFGFAGRWFRHQNRTENRYWEIRQE